MKKNSLMNTLMFYFTLTTTIIALIHTCVSFPKPNYIERDEDFDEDDELKLIDLIKGILKYLFSFNERSQYEDNSKYDYGDYDEAQYDNFRSAIFWGQNETEGLLPYAIRVTMALKNTGKFVYKVSKHSLQAWLNIFGPQQ